MGTTSLGTRSSADRSYPTTTSMPTDSCWQITSSRRRSDRRTPSTSTRLPRMGTVSSTISRPAAQARPGFYCDSPDMSVEAFRRNISSSGQQQIMTWEDQLGSHYPLYIYRIAAFWQKQRNCFDMPTLPDELTRAGITWKYYADTENIYNALEEIKHVRFGPEWKNVQSPDQLIKDLRSHHLPHVSWVNPPVSYDEHPGSGVSVCAGENWTVQH